MKKNTFLITKCVFIALLFVSFSLVNLYIRPISSIIGIISCAIQFLVVYSTKKAMWLKFIIPMIPIVMFIGGIIDTFYPSEPSGGLFPMAFEPWFELQLYFYLLYMVALFPTAITVILRNKIVDKFFLIIIYLFCIDTALFLYVCYPDNEYLYFTGLVVLLAVVVLIFPKKSQFHWKQEGV